MKNSLLVSGIAIGTCLFLNSCENATITTSTAQNGTSISINDEDDKERVEGNGKLLSQDRELIGFNKIDIEGVFNVILSQGGPEFVKVETDENIQSYILTSVENGILKLKMKDSSSIAKMKKINIYINIADIKGLSTKGVGRLSCKNNLVLKDLELNCNGVGATELDLTAENLVVHSEIVGLLKLNGDVKDVKINHSGLGAIQAFDLKTEKMKLVSQGIGPAEINTSKELIIHLDGLGSVKYKGSPSVKHIKKEGLGKVEQVD